MQSDKYGDIADLTRGLRVVTPAGTLATAAGADHVDRPERARDGARQRGAARDHHRGHGARPPAAGGARDPRLPLPDWVGGARRRCARSPRARPRRRSRASPTRRETQFSFATRKAGAVLDRVKSRALQAVLAAARASTSSGCASPFVGFEGSAGHVKAQRKLVGAHRHGARRALHRQRPGRALRPEEVRHALHPRLPARPRRARRRVGDRGAVVARCAALYDDGDGRGGGGGRRAGRRPAT